MLATENRTRSRIKRILAIALPVVGRQIRTIRVHGAILVALLGLVVSGFSQTTVSTGGIQGTVTDPSGALVTGAIVSNYEHRDRRDYFRQDKFRWRLHVRFSEAGRLCPKDRS